MEPVSKAKGPTLRMKGKGLFVAIGKKKTGTCALEDWNVEGDPFQIEKFLGTRKYGIAALAIQKNSGKKVTIEKVDRIYDNGADTIK